MLSTLWFGSLVPTMCNHTSFAQEHDLPQSHSGDNQEGTLFSWLHIYYAHLASVRFEHSVCHGSLAWNLPETGVTKAWSDRNGVRSAGLSISFGCCFKKFYKNIVRKGAPTLPFQNNPPDYRMLPFLKIPHPPILWANQSSQVFLINRNATVKVSSINTIHVKQQLNDGFFIFKFTLKYMLGNAYIDKMHSWQCLYNDKL